MALTIVAQSEPEDVYVDSLCSFIAGVSPLLLEQDRWDSHTLLG